MKPSSLFLASIFSLKILSFSALSSASLISASISLSDKPPEDWIVIVFSLLLTLSFALTLIIPSASMSKVTSTCGTPLGAGSIPSRLNSPNDLLYFAFWEI